MNPIALQQNCTDQISQIQTELIERLEFALATF